MTRLPETELVATNAHWQVNRHRDRVQLTLPVRLAELDHADAALLGQALERAGDHAFRWQTQHATERYQARRESAAGERDLHPFLLGERPSTPRARWRVMAQLRVWRELPESMREQVRRIQEQDRNLERLAAYEARRAAHHGEQLPEVANG
jgi:hypothetical protein